MMIFCVTFIDECTEIRQFTYALGSLEADLGFIDNINIGHCLLRVQLLDKTGAIDLPLEMFDGPPAAIALKQLEAEWKTVLI